MTTAMRILVTNDDGIDSPGLHALAALARDAGFDVVVAAPHEDASGVGASVKAVHTPHGVRLHRREIASLPGVEAYAVEAHPAFIVHAAGRGWLDPEPDIVLSGVNYGANVGRAVIHSGTVGAALTASLHGWRALAVSLDSGPEIPEHPHWDAVAHVLPRVLDLLLDDDDGTVVSLNVPDRAIDELGELREARLSEFGMATITVSHHDDADNDNDGAAVLRATADALSHTPDPEWDRVPEQHQAVLGHDAAGHRRGGELEQPDQVELLHVPDRRPDLRPRVPVLSRDQPDRHALVALTRGRQVEPQLVVFLPHDLVAHPDVGDELIPAGHRGIPLIVGLP